MEKIPFTVFGFWMISWWNESLGHKSPFRSLQSPGFFYPFYLATVSSSALILGPHTRGTRQIRSRTHPQCPTSHAHLGLDVCSPKKRLDSWYWHRCRWEVTNNPGSLAVVTQSISSWPSFFGAPWSACAPGMSNQQILKKLHQKFPPSPWVPPLSHADPFFGYADRAVSAFWGFNP